MSVTTLSASRVRDWIPRRSPDAHKGSVGRVYIVAGSRGFVGAAALAALGAVRSGAGLVRVGVPLSLQSLLVRKAPMEITTEGFAENRAGQFSRRSVSPLQTSIRSFQTHVMAIGPGLGVGADTQSLTIHFLKTLSQPMVIDADGVTILSQLVKIPRGAGPRLITPHPGELSRLLGWSVKKIQSNRASAVKMGARKIFGVCLLKGQGTLISDGDRVFKNPTGNSKMASGGMGDLLTGMIASLWAQMKERSLESGFRAACIGAYWHGMAGDLAARDISGLSVAASQAADFLPRAFKKII